MQQRASATWCAKDGPETDLPPPHGAPAGAAPAVLPKAAEVPDVVLCCIVLQTLRIQMCNPDVVLVWFVVLVCYCPQPNHWDYLYACMHVCMRACMLQPKPPTSMPLRPEVNQHSPQQANTLSVVVVVRSVFRLNS